jgi:hypothetical protein
MKRDFTKISFYSKLFKGRSNWYFCYLKAEKLAHVLAVLASRSVSEAASALENTSKFAGQIVQDIVYASAGEVMEETLLADLFSMMTTLRLHVSRGYLHQDTAKLLLEEYEGIVERMVGESRHLGVSVTAEDLEVSPVPEEAPLPSLPYPNHAPEAPSGIKDIYKGHSADKGHMVPQDHKGHLRTSLILDFVRKNRGASIKDISRVIKDCSEKTIQRELNTLIEQGAIIREGERRWSTYRLA